MDDGRYLIAGDISTETYYPGTNVIAAGYLVGKVSPRA